MLNYQTPLDSAFQALADPARRSILERLTKGPASVSELAKPLPMSLPAVMLHLKVLEDSGLVKARRWDGCAPAASKLWSSPRPNAGSPNAARCGSAIWTGWAHFSMTPNRSRSHEPDGKKLRHV